ncbi:MAG TPA: hypothetical protein VIB11_10860 [Pedococcus sp.]|uniref:hypothetical protein n=1 Tax=Pedococcus sp. TaxID=2860345 RepID=UPI002F95EDE6
MAPATSPVPPEVAEELRRVAQRWQQLPLGHALSYMPLVRSVVVELAGQDVPDLGPAAVIDQLTVLVYDTCASPASGRSGAGVDSAAVTRAVPGQLAAQLAALRRALA